MPGKCYVIKTGQPCARLDQYRPDSRANKVKVGKKLATQIIELYSGVTSFLSPTSSYYLPILHPALLLDTLSEKGAYVFNS